MTRPREMCDTTGAEKSSCWHTPEHNIWKRKSSECESSGEKDRQQRRKILNEIYETEKTYQHHLVLLTTLFLEPVKVSSILPVKIIEGLFSNIEAIQSVSLHLLELMKEHGVVHSLLELAPYLKLYSIYANNFTTSSKLLEELQNRSADFTRLLKFQESREEMESLKLSSLLVTPIQRVPRYRLLLQNLLEKTQEDDPNFQKLKDAYEEIAKVTSHINECVRQHENFNKMLTIQNSFIGGNAPQILLPGRWFLREGLVSQISKRGNAKDRMLFLFNDMLVCAKKEPSNMHQCCDVFHLMNCIVEQVMGCADNGNGLFKIICPDKSILLCSKTGDRGWVADIKTAISELHGNLASLKRCDMLKTPSYETLKVKPRSKVTSPRNLFKSSKSSQLNFGSSPLLTDLANLTSGKRSVIIEPPISIYDLYRRNTCVNETMSCSFEFDVESFLANTSLLVDNTNEENENENSEMESANEVNENFELYEVDEKVTDESDSESDVSIKATADWTVTERYTEHREALSSLSDNNLCCSGKRKHKPNRTSPYKKKTKLDDDVFSSLYTTECEKRVASPSKCPTSSSPSSSCLLM